MPQTLADVRRRLKGLANPTDAAFLRGFFKTGKGQYAEGDRFLGIRVPATRRLAREFRDLSIEDTESLLFEPWHEARLLGLILLVDRFKTAEPRGREKIFRLYLRNTDRVNNWDLVDLSAPGIVGAHLEARSDRSVLDKLSRSKSLWERRISIIATQRLIRAGQVDDTIRIAGLLLRDPHDLIHKAVGWMLRVVGDREPRRLEEFLDAHAHEMPRTMLRYAIEKMALPKRQKYMHIPRPGV